MSVPHGTYTAQPSIDIPFNSYGQKPKVPFWYKPIIWLQDGLGDIANGLNQCLSFLMIAGIFSLVGGGVVAWFGYQFMAKEMNKKVMEYESKNQVVSFNTFADELGKIDPEEKKNFETTKVLCSDGFINSNPEADMKQVCVNEYYGRKRKNRSKIAQAEES